MSHFSSHHEVNQVPRLSSVLDVHGLRQSVRKTPSAVSRLGSRNSPARLGPKKISVVGSPVTGSDLFGREEDIAFLDDAWANRRTNVVTIVILDHGNRTPNEPSKW